MNNQETLFAGNCIRTSTGLYIDVFNPTPDMICIEDIAHALSHLCRFGGHTKIFYSVAQHSVKVSENVGNELKLEALLHDASEAYLLDMPRPIKKMLPDYKVAEDNLMKVLSEYFSIPYPLSKEVKKADMIQLEIEHDALMLGFDDDIECWSPEVAKQRFLREYYRLKTGAL